MPSEHAKLSPSAAERWLSCPASIRQEEKVPPEPESVYAAEGTAAHTLAEIRARAHFGQDTPDDTEAKLRRWAEEVDGKDWDLDEMELHVAAYVELVQQAVDREPDATVLFEQRMDTGVPRCWGTSDTVVVSPVHIEIIDFKYGKGVAVEAENNPQLRLYALGALDTFGDLLGSAEYLRITVHQPRLEHTLTETITPDELRDWRTKIIPIAELALTDDAYFGPSDEACRWCPVSGRCRAQLEAVFAEDFEADPDLLTPEEMGERLGKVKMIKDWLIAFEEAALDTAYSQGESIPGYKVVMSGGRRTFTNVEAALEALEAAGYAFDEVGKRQLVGFGKLEQLLGDDFDTLLSGFITKSAGKPSLVKEADRRKSITPNTEAQREFGETP